MKATFDFKFGFSQCLMDSWLFFCHIDHLSYSEVYSEHWQTSKMEFFNILEGVLCENS